MREERFEIGESRQREPTRVSYCDYCGAALNPFYHFCTVCGKPYRSVESVVGSARPAPLTEGELIRRKASMAFPLFWTYVCVVFGGGIVAAVTFNEERPDLMLFLQTGLIFVTTCVFAVIYRRPLLEQLQRFGFEHAWAWWSLLLLAPTLLVNFLYHGFLEWAVDVEHVLLLDRLRDTGLSESTLIVMFCLYPAVTEEVAFRGLLQHWLHAALKPKRAIALAAFLFAAVHFSLPSLPYLFAVGYLLGWARWKTGSLYPSMLIHFLHNFVVIEFM